MRKTKMVVLAEGENFEYLFSRYYTIDESDRQTDRETCRQPTTA